MSASVLKARMSLGLALRAAWSSLVACLRSSWLRKYSPAAAMRGRVAAVDLVVGLDEDVEDDVVELVVVLVGAGEAGPAVDGAADERHLIRLLEDAGDVAEPLVGEFLVLDEPAVGLAGGIEVAGLLADLAEEEMAVEGVGVGLEMIAKEFGGLVPRPMSARNRAAEDLDARAVDQIGFAYSARAWS